MMKKSLLLLAFTAIITQVTAQKSKVQAAWRSLSDYEESMKEGRPDVSYLNKAGDAIELALQNEDTKKQTKTHAYKLRISYYKFQNALAAEMKKLEPSVQDKNERAIQAYGFVGLQDFDAAVKSLESLRAIDQKYLDNVQENAATGNAEDDELKLANAVGQMKMESANIASGRYRAKKYDEAADYFYRTAIVNSVAGKQKDTANFYNACIAASKARNADKMLEYNRQMIDAKVASPYNYESLYNANLMKGDSAAAIESLKKGRGAFPSDASLLTQETNLFLATGRQKEALANLKLALEREPNNALYYFIVGNIYDNMANPKDKLTGKDLPKPEGFNDLFRNAETNYQKSIDLKPANKEYLYNSLYNLGAMYNNYGGYIASQTTTKITDAVKMQKENEAKAQEYYKKAIPYLEQALSLKPEDKPTIGALRKLYMLTGNDAKAKEMSERLKTLK